MSRALTKDTRDKYLRAVDGFLSWADELGENPTSFTDFDELCCDYVEHLYDTHQSRSKASNTLFGIKFFLPGARRRLHRTTLALRGWERLHPSVSYPPLTWELACAMAVKATKAGFSAVGLGIVLQFDCLLRISELVALRRQDVVFEGDPTQPAEFKGALLCLRHTKTGRDQSVTVQDPDVLRLLRQHCDSLPRDDSPLFPFRADHYRRIFKRVAASLGLSPRYVPHSCRHGGATRLFQQNPLALETIKRRGRWKSLESAKRYIQQGVMLLTTVTVPRAVAQLGKLFAASLWESISMVQR